ncbi:MAG: MlaD family protein [Halieaceae bacterium]
MSKPVNTVAIGAFVAGAAVILFSLAFYLGGSAFRGDSSRGLLIFDGSIKGLNIGAPVAFKGVQIGEVTGIHLVIDPSNYDVLTPVEIKIDINRIKRIGGVDAREDELQSLIDRGLRAQLQKQSLLTGLLYVQFDYYPNSELRYTADDFNIEDDDIVVMPTIPTDMERLSRSLDNIDLGKMVDDISAALAGVDKLINDPETQALPGNLNQSLLAIEALSTRLKTEIDTLSPDVQNLVAGADATVQELNRELPELSKSARRTMDELTAALQTAESTLDSVNYLLSDDSAVLYDVRNAAQELSAAGRALQSLAETLETQPESLLRGKSPLGN